MVFGLERRGGVVVNQTRTRPAVVVTTTISRTIDGFYGQIIDEFQSRAHGVHARDLGWGVVAGYLTSLTESSLEGLLLRPFNFLCIGLRVALAQPRLSLDGEASLGKNSLKILVAGGEDAEIKLIGTQRSRRTP
jgi:hypothetical protein